MAYERRLYRSGRVRLRARRALFWQLSRLMFDAADGKLSPAAWPSALRCRRCASACIRSDRPTIWTALLCTLTARILPQIPQGRRAAALLRLLAIAVAEINLKAAQ